MFADDTHKVATTRAPLTTGLLGADGRNPLASGSIDRHPLLLGPTDREPATWIPLTVAPGPDIRPRRRDPSRWQEPRSGG